MVRLPLRRPRLRPRPVSDSGVSDAAHRRALRTQPADSPPAFQAYDRAKRLSGRPSPAAYEGTTLSSFPLELVACARCGAASRRFEGSGVDGLDVTDRSILQGAAAPVAAPHA